MSIQTQMLNRISEETRKHQVSSAELQPVEKANMIVEVGCAEDLKQMCQEKTNLLEYSIEGSGMKEAEYNTAAYATIVYRSMNPTRIECKLTSVRDGLVTQVKVQQKKNAAYEIEYIPQVRGQHKLEITANGLPVPGSPYSVFVKISPTQLGELVKVIDGVDKPVDIAINSAGEVLVAEQSSGVVVLDKSGKKLYDIAKSQYHFKDIRGIAMDKHDNIYLTDRESRKLFKFNKTRELVKVIGQGLQQFNPRGINVCGEQVIVGSRDPSYLYIFHSNLELDRKIDLRRVGVGDVTGIASDERMNLYICDFSNGGVHVLSLKGKGELLYSFGKEQLYLPRSICISGGLLYISVWSGINTIFVFSKEGMFVASFGSFGNNQGQRRLPGGLVIDADGFLYVCDQNTNRLQLF